MAQEPQQEPDELKKTLVRRAAIAGVLIALLLGSLALFDYLMTAETVRPAPPAGTALPAPEAKPEEKPAEEAKPEEKPMEEKPAEEAKPEAPEAAPEKTVMPLAPPPPARPEAKPAPAGPSARLTPAPAPKAEPPAPPRAPEAKPPALPPLPRGYVLQMGVFGNAFNAEELRARLEAAGIPATVEARVQVGPFKTRQEALTAQEKLKARNFGPGLLIPPKK